MKKTLLLATTAMLLSTAAMNTNAQTAQAPSNTIQLPIYAAFYKPMTLEMEHLLAFGPILADEGGKRVVVKTDGTLDVGETTATMLSVASGAGGVLAHAGIIRAIGLNSGNDGYESSAEILKIDTGGEVTLKMVGDDGALGRACATVKELHPNLTADGDDVLIRIGGILETNDLRDMEQVGAICAGEATVTVLLNDEVHSSD